jgi:hypothetical protein
MAHKGWCGKPCSDCKSPCSLDESMTCSPDCELMMPDGSRMKDKCEECGCDAYASNEGGV